MFHGSKSGPIVAPSMLRGPVDDRLVSGPSVNSGNGLQTLRKQAYGTKDVVTLNRDDIIGGPARLAQRDLPVWRIALTQNATKGDGGSLHRPGVGAAVHHES